MHTYDDMLLKCLTTLHWIDRSWNGYHSGCIQCCSYIQPYYRISFLHLCKYVVHYLVQRAQHT